MSEIVIQESEGGLVLRLNTTLGNCLRSSYAADSLVAEELARAISEDSQLSDLQQEFELSFATVSHWREETAIACGFGKNCPFGMDLRIQGVLGKEKTKLTVRWLKPGTSVALSGSPKISGPRIQLGSHTFRLQAPFVEILDLVQEFNELGNDQVHKQYDLWAKIRRSLGDQYVSQVSDHFLRALRILTCDSFTLNVAQERDGSLQIVPRLLLEDPDLDANGEKRAALTDKDDAILASRLDLLPSGSSTFPVSDGVYVVGKAGVPDALRAIREIRKWPPGKRKDAFLKPVATITEVLQDLGIEVGEIPFVETDGYSSRVLDIGTWAAPIVPWLKLPSQPWLPPEEYGLLIGDEKVQLKKNEVQELSSLIEKAIESGQETVDFNGRKIPANESTCAALSELAKDIEKVVEPETKKDDSPKSESQPKSVTALIIGTNFESQDYKTIRSNRRAGEFGLPSAIKSQPKEHQQFGLKWLQAHWKTGSKGALLADDMGLGKTYQALAFMSWLRELMSSGEYPERPILIVAPVGLLKNWEEEHGIHLLGEGLGEVVRLYGKHLNQIKRGSHKTGTASLDTKKISGANWVLANYETVSDYQIALGAVHFAAAIYDEAQKIKSPQARMTHACKALHCDFNLVVTGTPVENRMADFWCLADTAQPFCLGDLKTFSKKYESEGCEEAIKVLRDSVWQEEHSLDVENPKLMLRRLKKDNLKGLPRKEEVFIERDMPAYQAEIYERVVSKYKREDDEQAKVTMLEIIQNLRQASLHPALLTDVKQGINFADSARFNSLFEILDEIHSRGEKALIFLESLALQETGSLPSFLMKRYGMSRLPLIINGQVETSVRQDRVTQFQTGVGFDVMILSPKAGGVGLTLTAANHVIHLSRWWNPAVEDQCSDRVYRIGQSKDVKIYYPMATYSPNREYSFDLKLNALMQRKKEMSGQLLMPAVIGKDEFGTLFS